LLNPAFCPEAFVEVTFVSDREKSKTIIQPSPLPDLAHTNKLFSKASFKLLATL
jgi:hypothetical protein